LAETPLRIVLKPNLTGDFKKTVVSIQDVHDRNHILVVAIRGSKTIMDWLVNLNSMGQIVPVEVSLHIYHRSRYLA
jgi:hypothetical protein